MNDNPIYWDTLIDRINSLSGNTMSLGELGDRVAALATLAKRGNLEPNVDAGPSFTFRPTHYVNPYWRVRLTESTPWFTTV